MAEDNNHDAISIYEEEGEHMTAMDITTAVRREALEARRSTGGDAQERLSRDLEEGFMDDTSDEEEEEPRRVAR